MASVTRADLCEAAVEATGLARQDVSNLLDRMLDLMGESLMARETVNLTGFGSLQVRSRAARVGRNPRTGTEHAITARHTVVFTPSAQLREAMDEFSSANHVGKVSREVSAVER